MSIIAFEASIVQLPHIAFFPNFKTSKLISGQYQILPASTTTSALHQGLIRSALSVFGNAAGSTSGSASIFGGGTSGDGSSVFGGSKSAFGTTTSAPPASTSTSAEAATSVTAVSNPTQTVRSIATPSAVFRTQTKTSTRNNDDISLDKNVNLAPNEGKSDDVNSIDPKPKFESRTGSKQTAFPKPGRRYDCTICQSQCNSQVMLNAHLKGSKHKKNLKLRENKVQKSTQSFGDSGGGTAGMSTQMTPTQTGKKRRRTRR